jgi:hypothetical protein
MLCCLNDILIYMANDKDHKEYVSQVLQRLGEFNVYCRSAKYQFRVLEVGFRGFVINPDGVGMELDRICTIKDWLTPKSLSDVQVLLGSTNLCRRFIRNYANSTLPLTELPKKPETSPRGKTGTNPPK